MSNGENLSARSTGSAAVPRSGRGGHSARSAGSSARSVGSGAHIIRHRSVPTIRCDRQNMQNVKAIPGYTGYIAGKNAESIAEGLFTNIVYEAQHATKKLGHLEQDRLLTRKLKREAENWQPSLVPPTTHEV